MNFKQKYGSLALIAGASEGLGAAFARAFAAQGLDLLLIARREDLLLATADTISKQYGINVSTLACDLGAEDAVLRIKEALGGRALGCLIYNAAASQIGPFLDYSLTEHMQMAKVNMLTPLQLLHAFAPTMLANRKGAIVLMSSLAAFQGAGFLALYAATKSFNRILAESLWYEWRSKGVDVLACCAGATDTPNYAKSNPGRLPFWAPKPQIPDQVVKECLRRLGSSPSFVPGTSNKLASLMMHRIFSRKKATVLMSQNTAKLYSMKS